MVLFADCCFFVYLCGANTEKLKKIAAITMVRNDDFFLRKWVEYYGGELGRENLYIYFDGEDQIVGDFCQGANVHVHSKIGTQVVAAEKGRLGFLSEKAVELFAGKAVVNRIIDPSHWPLWEYSSSRRVFSSHSFCDRST